MKSFSLVALLLASFPAVVALISPMTMKVQPLWKMEPEKKARKRGFQHILGSDEAGNGCIAGPIVVSTCTIRNYNAKSFKPIEGVQDSKLLTPEDLERIYNCIVNNPDQYAYNTALASAADIDETDIPQATKAAMKNSIELMVEQQELPLPKTYSIVDGHKTPKLDGITCRPWVKGDSQVYTVALASVVAKVTHQQIMEDMHKLYPEYGFNANRGYPTREQITALHTHGPCPIHRQSAKPVKDRSNTAAATTGTRRDLIDKASAAVVMSTLGLGGLPREAQAVYKDSKTGTLLPEVGEMATAIPTYWTNVDNPVGDGDTSLFSRLDNAPDSQFYVDPRFVEHIDENAVKLMTNYISDKALQQGDSVLDLCSSWTSHIRSVDKLKRVAGLGMNEKELSANPALTEWVVRDLNQEPKLPYDDKSFSVVVCQLSIDYLTKPLQVMKEVGRVLRPGGRIHILFSNRLFLQKAVALWTGKDDIDHAYTVGCYLHFSDGGFETIVTEDLSTRSKGNKIVGDPLYVVTATKR